MQASVHNVIVFGESGCGKSSLVNMIVGEDVAHVSSEPSQCTSENRWYEAVVGTSHFRIYDTANPNEGPQGRLPHWMAIRELYTLIQGLSDVSLLICCFRGTIKDHDRTIWTLFNDVICGGGVPIISVMTGLEHEDWTEHAKRIRTALGVYKMNPVDVATVVSTRGRNGQFADKYEASQERLRNLIIRHHRAWRVDKEAWLRNVYVMAYKTRIGLDYFGATTKAEFRDRIRTAIQEFVANTNMNEVESKKLQDTLVAAERVITRKSWWWPWV